jgi:HK97 family phage major capsid protein
MPLDGTVTPEDVQGLKTDLAKVSDEVKNFATDILAKVKAGQDVSAELKEKADKALSEQGAIVQKLDKAGELAAALGARLAEVEQMVVRGVGSGHVDNAHKTPGEIFINDERVKAFMADRPSRSRVRVDLAAITTASVGATRDVLVSPDRQAGFIALPDRRLTVRDLLTPGRTASNAVQYVRETGFTNNAAPVSEGQPKPESDIDFELKTLPVSTIAHFMRASKQVLEDAPALQSHIDGRLRYGLAYVEEGQMLLGDGTGVNLWGIIPQATAYSGAFTPTDSTPIDTLRLAHLQSELALFPSTGQVLSPTDWARIELTKDTQGRYIFANVQGNVTPTMWGRPVVSTPAMTNDKFLVGAFRLGAQIFDREDANVEISTEDADNFTKNMITIRGEERLVLVVYRPEAFIYGGFGLVT